MNITILKTNNYSYGMKVQQVQQGGYLELIGSISICSAQASQSDTNASVLQAK